MIQLKMPVSMLAQHDAAFRPNHHVCYTGNLDTQNSNEVITLLKNASKRYAQTIIMITHSRSIAQTADRVLQVSDGVLTDLGRCSE